MEASRPYLRHRICEFARPDSAFLATRENKHFQTATRKTSYRRRQQPSCRTCVLYPSGYRNLKYAVIVAALGVLWCSTIWMPAHSIRSIECYRKFILGFDVVSGLGITETSFPICHVSISAAEMCIFFQQSILFTFGCNCSSKLFCRPRSFSFQSREAPRNVPSAPLALSFTQKYISFRMQAIYESRCEGVESV